MKNLAYYGALYCILLLIGVISGIIIQGSIDFAEWSLKSRGLVVAFSIGGTVIARIINYLDGN